MNQNLSEKMMIFIFLRVLINENVNEKKMRNKIKYKEKKIIENSNFKLYKNHDEHFFIIN